MTEKWLDILNQELLETKKLADAAEIQAREAIKRTEILTQRTDYIFALMFATQNRPWWKKFLGVEAKIPQPK